MPTCSVVVVNWNGRHHLDACLESLSRQVYRDFEVVLVDNGSTDGSADHVRSAFPWVRLIALGENRGFSGGSNAGIRESGGELVALLNNDTEVDPGWLAELVKMMRQRPDVALCASRILFFNDRDRVDSAGDEYAIAGVAAKRGHLEPAALYDEPAEVFGASAAGALYRRAVLDAIGLLDEDFFLVFEDVDLSFRARLAGGRCLYVPAARVYHKLNASIGTYSRAYVFYGQRNLEWVLIKNMPGTLLLKYLPLHLLYEVLALVFFAGRGRLGTFLRAKLAALRALPRMMRKRAEIQRLRVVSAAEVDRMLARAWLRPRWRAKGRFGRPV